MNFSKERYLYHLRNSGRLQFVTLMNLAALVISVLIILGGGSWLFLVGNLLATAFTVGVWSWNGDQSEVDTEENVL